MRLIDAEALLDSIPEMWTLMDVGRVVTAPTVEAVPVVHAHWNCIENVVSYEGTFDAYECSHCHKSLLDDLCENNGSDYVNAKNDFKYCPFCGAKMDEKVEEKK